MLLEDFSLNDFKEISKQLTGKFKIPEVAKYVEEKYSCEYLDAFAATMNAIQVKKAHNIIKGELKHMNDVIDGRKLEIAKAREKAN